MSGDLLEEAVELTAAFEAEGLETLLARAVDLRNTGFGRNITYSRKVFIPLTQLCRDACAYCTFAKTPREVGAAYLSSEQILAIARQGEKAGCREALFTLGDKPELRYASARDFLRDHGFSSTVDYIEHACRLVLEHTSLLPHINAGVMGEDDIARLRKVSVSQGLMLESISERLCDRDGPHFGSPDKAPAMRIATIEAAGRQNVPFTSGILIGIGETRLERIQSLLTLKALHQNYGHLQEVIIQNFRAKSGTRLAHAAEPNFDELRWTAAVARLILGATMNIQVPPNLSYEAFPKLLDAGINDWGGISPVTPDHVNPEAPWPAVVHLEQATRAAGLSLQQRLAVYPEYALQPGRWIDTALAPRVHVAIDSEGLVREDNWSPGSSRELPPRTSARPTATGVEGIIHQACAGRRLSKAEVQRLFSARDGEVEDICSAANELRSRINGNVVRYVVNRNINYTNVCAYRCQFCAFSKGRTHDHLRGLPYDLSLAEVARRAKEAWERGATEVCMQGGISPDYSGKTYLALLRSVKDAAPAIHVHAFSPLEIFQGASTLGVPVERFLAMLKDAGLGSLPGTAAEILDDAVRRVICPDKLSTDLWLDIIHTAHRVGLRSTATIMFGHVESPASWAEHLLRVRDLQEKTAGFTEFVPLPFIHMEAPMFLRGRARPGPTWREVRLMHAVARLVLHPMIDNIQASWVKLGPDGVSALLDGGVNDLGGTLMNESISRAAGTEHGQECPPAMMETLIASSGRIPEQRNTLYGPVPEERTRTSFAALPLMEPVLTPFRPRAENAARVS